MRPSHAPRPTSRRSSTRIRDLTDPYPDTPCRVAHTWVNSPNQARQAWGTRWPNKRSSCKRDDGDTRHTQQVSVPSTVDGVIARPREIDAELSPDDGVAVFNRMYLTVTERIAAVIAGPTMFRNSEMIAELDVGFANLWLRRTTRTSHDRPSPRRGSRSSRHVAPGDCLFSTP